MPDARNATARRLSNRKYIKRKSSNAQLLLRGCGWSAQINTGTRNDVRRLVCISALGVGDSRGHGGFVFDRLFQPLLLSQGYKDGQEAAIRASSLDWVIARPGMLTDDPAQGSVRAVIDLAGINGGKVARADVAWFVVDQLTTDSWLRRTPVMLW